MAPPTWVSGQVLTASDVNSWFVPLAAIKTVDESVTSSATLQNDDVLFVSVAANASYLLACYLTYEGGTQNASDLKIGWTFPAGTTMRWVGSYVSLAGNSTTGGGFLETDTLPAGSNGAGNNRSVMINGTVVVSSTAGTFQLQWAQNTSNATATKVHARSALALWRIA